MEDTTQLIQIILDNGFSEAGILDVKDLNFYPELRKICESNTCRNYESCWACPPATGTLEECKSRLRSFEKMILFSKIYQLSDCFDFEGMVAALKEFKSAVEQLDQVINPILSRYLVLSNEGCGKCKQCTYPNSPCRFPHLLHHSIEGYGLYISELAQNAGMKYNNGENTVTYFGALLFAD